MPAGIWRQPPGAVVAVWLICACAIGKRILFRACPEHRDIHQTREIHIGALQHHADRILIVRINGFDVCHAGIVWRGLICFGGTQGVDDVVRGQLLARPEGHALLDMEAERDAIALPCFTQHGLRLELIIQIKHALIQGFRQNAVRVRCAEHRIYLFPGIIGQAKITSRMVIHHGRILFPADVA